ncbi:MAG: SNF2-related protein [Ilumatobacteraceae bacterium]
MTPAVCSHRFAAASTSRTTNSTRLSEPSRCPAPTPLIADDVGLGKTIESGLVAQELVLRHRARRILIICPAGLQVQWREQMRDKFDSTSGSSTAPMRDLRRQRGIHVNPWGHHPRLIVSMDYVKRT